jgi:hypothetical protein
MASTFAIVPLTGLRCHICLGVIDRDVHAYGKDYKIVGTHVASDPIGAVLMRCKYCDIVEDKFYFTNKPFDQSAKSYSEYLLASTADKMDTEFYQDELGPVRELCSRVGNATLDWAIFEPFIVVSIFRLTEQFSKNVSRTCQACGISGECKYFATNKDNRTLYLDSDCAHRLIVLLTMEREMYNAERAVGILSPEKLYHNWRAVVGTCIVFHDQFNSDCESDEEGAEGNNDIKDEKENTM